MLSRTDTCNARVLSKDLPVRFSMLQLPVEERDGLSACMHIAESVFLGSALLIEEMRSLARSNLLLGPARLVIVKPLIRLYS